ncbi:MAG: hypothetical protein DWQ37_17375 [Planctomycetota bacterium]|nr:MAG: hypothetical protein DWQ37_17375 [Planctomycetota bacterium]
MKLPVALVSSMALAALLLGCRTPTRAADLSRAVVVVPEGLSPRETKAVEMLRDEIQKRTEIELPLVPKWPEGDAAVIAVGPASLVETFAGPLAADLAGDKDLPAEGFRIRTRGAQLAIAGNDERGVLFGIGYLLRHLKMTHQAIALPEALDVTTAPAYPLRGHQLGYRPKTNSYDAWDLDQWEQYYRDLAVFGTNAIELIPPRSDDAATSPHFPRPQIEMMEGMSRLADEYGLVVWIWYPALDKDYGNPETVEFALKEWETVYKRLPRIDAIFVPGGDPGHTEPAHMMNLLEKQTALLREYHPDAEMWLSPQGFTTEWMQEFKGLLEQEPEWLAGIVFGPQVRPGLPELRKLVPERYPIRRYPDITHSRQSQYPVPDWDLAHALTSAREPINPRPTGQATIFRVLQPYAIGFLTYSEGCNDDVNKFVWSGLGWDPEKPVIEILREYSRYFLGPALTDDFAQGLLALERNWQGALLTNDEVYQTLARFQDMEAAAGLELMKNWRFQQALYRAYYDAYVRARLIYETDLEARAMDQLRQAEAIGALEAMDKAEAILARADQRVATDWRDRVFELADALFESIRMQTSVGKYKAISVGRGATLDTVDVPLNNRPWLEQRFAALREESVEAERLAGIEEIVDWTNPGPGGFYDDLGKLHAQPHLVVGPGFERDPAFLESSHTGFAGFGPMRTSWKDHAEAMLDGTLKMRYENLDPEASYKMRVVYAGDDAEKPMRCVAGDDIEIHPYITRKRPIAPVEFDIPREATKSGTLELTWHGPKGIGSNGRNVQVSEIWIIKK